MSEHWVNVYIEHTANGRTYIIRAVEIAGPFVDQGPKVRNALAEQKGNYPGQHPLEVIDYHRVLYPKE